MTTKRTRPVSTRERITVLGQRGGRRVLVLRERSPRGTRYVVERYISGVPKRRVFRSEALAQAWAQEWFKAGDVATQPKLTLREALDRYFDVESRKKEWRGATVINYRNHRKRIEEILLPVTTLEAIGVAHLDTLWNTLTDAGMAKGQVLQKVNLVKRLFVWAHAREYVSHNKPGGWLAPKVAKSVVAEYSDDEFSKILAQWNYQTGWDWRPWAFTLIAGTHGFRQNALLHIAWPDVEWTGPYPTRVVLQQAHDKTKREWSRPLKWEAISALMTARWHARRLSKASTWVFYGKGESGKPYTYGAYHTALLKAERAAKVPHVKRRAAHGFKRMTINNVRNETGDAALGLLWAGNTDLRSASSYVRAREAEFDQIAATVPAGIPAGTSEGAK